MQENDVKNYFKLNSIIQQLRGLMVIRQWATRGREGDNYSLKFIIFNNGRRHYSIGGSDTVPESKCTNPYYYNLSFRLELL